jgi:hypothetical protein
MVTTDPHDGHFPCWPSTEAGSCFAKEQLGQMKLILDMINYRFG